MSLFVLNKWFNTKEKSVHTICTIPKVVVFWITFPATNTITIPSWDPSWEPCCQHQPILRDIYSPNSGLFIWRILKCFHLTHFISVNVSLLASDCVDSKSFRFGPSRINSSSRFGDCDNIDWTFFLLKLSDLLNVCRHLFQYDFCLFV